jgi:hypothetical protein
VDVTISESSGRCMVDVENVPPPVIVAGPNGQGTGAGSRE